MKRFLYVFSLCGEDTGGLDPLQVNDEFIRTMSVNGVEIAEMKATIKSSIVNSFFMLFRLGHP